MTPTMLANHETDLAGQTLHLIQGHRRLHRQLLELKRISSLQLQADSPRIWQAILEQKQALLDQLEAAGMDTLFQHTRRVANPRSHNPRREKWQQLHKCQDDNIALLEEVVGIETIAENRLRKQTEEFQFLAAGANRTSKINNIYRGRSQASPPRFLDSRR
jgi:flagellar biosynthesis/type III secretory pathway chaperone